MSKSIKMHAERVAHAEAMVGRYLGDYNEAMLTRHAQRAEKWLAKSQYWPDVANRLRGLA